MINKITPPILKCVLPRHRLFEQFDRARDTQVIWLSGPAGAGKSTLVASFLSERQIPCIWYQIDVSDEDPASYFYYLGLAAQRTSNNPDTLLPLLTPEYVNGLDAFAMRYFEKLYNRLSSPFWIVFDNFQAALPHSPLQRVMRHAMDRVPPDLKMVVISRIDPAPEMVRFQANRRLKLIGWQDLAFTEAEFRDVIELLGQHRLSDNKVKLIHGQTRGWIATEQKRCRCAIAAHAEWHMPQYVLIASHLWPKKMMPQTLSRLPEPVSLLSNSSLVK